MATIRQREGRAKPWQAIVRRVVDGKTVAKSKSFTLERDAAAWARNVESALDDPKRRDEFTRDKTTVAQLIDRYIREVDPIKPLGTTKRNTLQMVRLMPIGDVVASELTAADLIAHCTRRRAADAAPPTVQQDIVYLRGVFGMARPAWKLPITTQPFDDAGFTLKKLELVGKSRSRERRLQPAEWDALRAYWERNGDKSSIPMRDIMEFALACPLRQGEIMRLRWQDVDETKRTIKVWERKHPMRKHDDIIPLIGVAFDIVMRQPKIDERIFPYNQSSVAAAWERARDACGLADIRFHDFRHEGISRMFEAGYQIHEVAIVSGHRDWNMLKRYEHVRPESLHR